MHNQTIKRLIGIAGVIMFITFIILVSYLFIRRFGQIIENPHEIREMMTGYGVWAYLVFSIFNIFQILFAPVPGTVLTVSSGILFGFLRGIIITWVSVIIGGGFAMIISRVFGKKILYYLLDEKAKEFEVEITKRGIAFILFLAIFPNPIGDGIFYLAGITVIPLKILVPLIALGRLPGIIISVLIGDKLLCAGLKGWLIGGAGFLLAIIFYILFRKKLERLFERVIKKQLC